MFPHFFSKNLLPLVGALLSVTMIGCSGGSNPDRAAVADPAQATKTISGVPFLTLKSEATAAGEIETIYAATPLEEIESGNHFRFQFELAPGGSITLFANARLSKETSSLERGVEFEITRSTDPTVAALSVIVRASGQEKNWSAFFSKLDARGPVTLGLDVHNDHGGQAHILAWSGDEHDHMFNSGSRQVGGSPGRGFGNLWGFRTAGANLGAVAVDHPRDEH